MTRHKTESTKVARVVRFKVDESSTSASDRLVACLPNGLVRLSRLYLVPGELAISVLKENIFMLFAEDLYDILSVIEHHATDDGSPCPLEPVTPRSLVSRVIRGEGLVGCERRRINHSNLPSNVRSSESSTACSSTANPGWTA